MELLINNRQEGHEISKELVGLLEKIALACLKYEDWDLQYEISLSLVDNSEIRELNKVYRGIDESTDVLSFPLVGDNQTIDMGEKLLGDIIISVEKAIEQAGEYNHSFEREMGFLMAHSMFHLMGYDHHTDETAKGMRAREEAVLSSLNLTRE